MHFNVALFTGLFLASETLAFPSGLAARLARRREGLQSQPSKLAASDASATGSGKVYTPNWAGAVWQKDNGTFIETTVVGTFTVPTPSGSPGDAATAWVGVDGNTCQSAILQTGVDFVVGEDGSPEYYAWYEWWPANWVDFSGISFSPGDVVRIAVEAYSTNDGSTVVENLSTGATVSQDIGDSLHSLCGQNAEWIVEDYQAYYNGPYVPFANFGTVTFTDAYAGITGSYTPGGATIFEIEQNGRVLTSTSASGSSVTIQYVG